MRYLFVFIFAVPFIASFSLHELEAQTIRIMPLGNSITYDHNSGDESNPRPAGQRISYRYKLYQLLKAGGYNFDFVGSEDAGNNYFQDSDYDDNAGFPGIETDELADLIHSGYNAYTKQYVSSGPYLNYFPTDIILLHIGTNNLITSPNDVESVLNAIRFYDSDVIILVARIINRKTYHSATTTFNNNVELMVNSRGDNRIKMVNIETGASINYSSDMYDNLHPNQSGYDKMGLKWFDAITKLNTAPVISSIPSQSTDKGESFPDLSLDPYVTDVEDADYLMAWTYQQEPGSELTVSIGANRVLHVTPNPDFSGSEVIKLKVTDTGNGAFPLSDSVEVTFNVDHVNSAPVIVSQPETIVPQGAAYSYTVVAEDVDDDPLFYSALTKPDWLSFNPETRILSGIPENDDVGVHGVRLRVTDGFDIDEQYFQIEVEDTNDPPGVTSSTLIEMVEDKYCSYQITAEDLDGDPISYTMISKPDWLSYNAPVHSLSGRPTNDEVGEYTVTVKLSDGIVDVYENLVVVVSNVNDLPVVTSTPDTHIGVGQSYIYRLTAEDIDPDDELVFSAVRLPQWLTFTVASSEALIYGSPTNSDHGTNLVILQVSDGTAEVLDVFNITVSWANGIEDERPAVQKVYPVPAGPEIYFDLAEMGEAEIRIMDMNGKLFVHESFTYSQHIELDISHLESGTYLYQVVLNGKRSVGKIVKN